MKKFDYENKEYLEKLNDLDLSYYSKYILYIKKYATKSSSIFDVGCGNGIVLSFLKKFGYKNLYGIDISKLFVKEAKSKGLENIYNYDGNKFPFKDRYFDLIGSFNVLEHTEAPEKFLKEQIRVLKQNGKLIIICPNFFSIFLFNNWHPRLKGGRRKLKNLAVIVNKLLGGNNSFEMTKPIKTKSFKYDSDAIAMTNLIDIKRSLERFNCKIIYESGFINYDNLITKAINKIPLAKYVGPSCVLVVRKIND